MIGQDNCYPGSVRLGLKAKLTWQIRDDTMLVKGKVLIC